ncbi:MAG: GNAT family N-acetyltransferase [Clostridiaceae bacterium]
MVGKVSALIEAVRGSSNEYIIKDKLGINRGRFAIFDLDKENKRCSLRINYYDEEESFLEESLRIILASIFKDKVYNKVNIYTHEDCCIKAFTACGLTLQGVLEDNVLYKGSLENEYIFGISIDKYYSMQLKGREVVKEDNQEEFYLKVLTPEYAEELLNYYIRNKEHLAPFEPKRVNSFFTLETQKENLAEAYRGYLNGSSVEFGVFLKDKLIGKIKVSSIVYGVFRSGIVGYSIDKDHEGKGYGKRALNLLCDYAFSELELHRLEGSTLLNNVKSQRVLKGCGFKELGRNEQYLHIAGKWQDHITFYRINEG